MAWEGWACFGGVEIVSSPRSASYAATAGLPVACGFSWFTSAALGYDGYGDITEAPWYDAYVPDSKGFMGVMGLSVEGTGGTGSSEWTDLLGDGARPGPLRRSAREVEFTTLLLATDEAALAYGLGWLSSALRGDLCDADCDADELVMMSAQPREPAIGEDDDCTPGQVRRRDDLWRAGEDDPDWEAAQRRGDELQRTLYNCRLLEGPTIEEKTRVSGGVIANVTFTIKAGRPYWYSEPSLVWHMSEDANDPADVVSEIWENYRPADIYLECEQLREDSDCLKPPPNDRYDCPAVEPPVRPAKPVDPCYQGTEYPQARWSLYRVKPGVAPEWFEKALVIDFQNGDREIRGLLMRWHQNPLQRPPDWNNIDPCGVCAEMWLAYLPPHARLTIDGRREKAEVECLGKRVAQPVLYGPGGGVFTWPTLDCGTSMFLEIVTDGEFAESTGTDAWFKLAARQDAI